MKTKLEAIYLDPVVQTKLAKRRLYQSKSVLIFPETAAGPAIAADSPEFIQFQRLVRDDLRELAPRSAAIDGLFDRYAMPVDWDRASFIAGYAMNPGPLPVLNNAQVVTDLELATRYLRPTHARIYSILFDLMLSPTNWVRTTTHFSKLSSTGAPFCISNDPEAKKAIVRHAVQHWKAIASLTLQHKYDELARHYRVSYNYICGQRRQTDPATLDNGIIKVKDRWVSDIEYVLTEGRRGSRLVADRTIRIKGRVIKDMANCRTRLVYGAPGAVTYPFTALLAGIRKYYFDKYAATWHHRGADDIKRKLQGFYRLWSLDVAQYDQSFSRFLIDEFTSHWARVLPEGTAEVLRQTFHMSVMAPQPNVETPGYLQFGNPAEYTDFSYGLPSGIAVNPDCGKFHVPFALICALDDETDDLHTRESIDRFLKGDDPRFQLLNCGDDSVIAARNEQGADIVARALVNKDKGWYFSIKPEQTYSSGEGSDTGVSFLGHTFYRDSSGHLEICPNIFSYYANWYMPERGTDHPSRRLFWATGFRSRRELYAVAPLFAVVDGVINKRFKQIFHASPEDYALAAGGQLIGSDLDQQVLQRPDLLHYRIDPDEVSPHVLDQVTSALDEDETERIAETLMKE